MSGRSKPTGGGGEGGGECGGVPSWAEGSVVDRRGGIDRRLARGDDGTGLERRRGPGRRMSDFLKAAEEGEFTKEQFLFVMAMQEFKRANGCTFPTWTDVLEVIRLLGYRKTCGSELNLRSAEDWRESPNTASNVRPPRWAERRVVDASRATGTPAAGEGPRREAA
ncbi:MAG: hypothetical protein HRU70_08945 [Phycisphaeraceae bacterium]|nr:MAG: hypothetical protein HRU70_08945 [Phycisphaeraceae bacterium]